MSLPQYGPAVSGAVDLADFVTQIEQLGYDSLWAGDRLFTPLHIHSPYPGGDDDAYEKDYLETMSAFGDPFVVVAAAATVTSRMRLNFSTLNAPLHQPIHLARTLTTLDVLSGGRLDVGFGLGWMKDEYDALGLSWSSRGRRLDDILSFLRTWWTMNPVQYDSEFISLPPSQVGLRPVQVGGPPIYLGGASPAALARVGRSAVGWLGFDGLPEELEASLWSTARHEAEAVGRDPDDLKKVVRVNGERGETVEHLADRVARVEERGADEAIVDFVFSFPTLGERLEAAARVAERCCGDVGVDVPTL
jgi:probable F420-dependent oxidoreductase